LGVLALGGWGGPAAAADAPATGSVMLNLEGGQSPASAAVRESRDMELELVLKDGRWQKDVWGYAVWFNRADHEGTIEKVEAAADGSTKMHIKMTLNPDKWTPGGEAEYRLEIRRDGRACAGTFTGTFQGVAVQGPVAGAVYPLWSQPAPGFKPLEPGEHPRLIFRKGDLEELKRRAATPEGKAIMDRCMALLDKNIATHNKCQPMFCAGHGFAYQMTGDRAYADKARAFLADKIMPMPAGSQDIHFGPYAMGAALTFDFCYDAWPPEFRTQVVDWLMKRTRDLATGENIGTYSPNPWHNHNGVRAPCCGLAAIALVGEKGSDGTEMPGLDKLIHIIARDVRRYLVLGLGETGWCMEGDFYKRMTWNAGPGHFIRAYRAALGGDLTDAWPGAYTILGEWMQEPPGARTGALDLGNDESSGLWPAGLVTVPPAMRPGARWLYDRTFGLEGDKTFGCAWAYQAAYALANYPFDVPARPPGECLPWAAPDLRKGHYVFRRPWADKNDCLAVLHYKSEVLRGCHYERAGDTGDVEVWALGKPWISGVSLPAAGPTNTFLGAKTTYFNATEDGAAVLSLRLDDIYLTESAGKAAPKGGKKRGEAAPPADPFAETRPPAAKADDAGMAAQGVTVPRAPGTYVDHGVRAMRYMAVDFSGACGAPALFAILDQVQGAKSVAWRLALAKEAGAVKVDGAAFTAGDPGGLHLRGVFAAPAAPKLSGNLSAAGGDEYFVVFTIQNGPAPAVKVEGDGAKARVSVGGRTVSFDGAKIVLSK
jgi:hypothetical protein